MTKSFRYHILAAFISFICGINPAEATIKFDVSKGVGKVTTTVSGWGETAKKQMEQSSTLQTLISYGKGAVETAKKLKSIKDSVDNAMAAADNLAAEAQSAVADAVSEAQNAVGEVAGDALSQTGDALSQTGDAQELLELKAEKMELESQRDDAIAAAQDEINGKISLAQENISKLQSMMEQEPDNQISKYNEELQTVSDTVTSQYQSQITAVDEQITALRDEAVAKAGEAAAGKIKSVFGGGNEEDAAAMNEMIKNNFLAEDDALTIENISKIKAYRKLTSVKDTVDAFNYAWQIKKSRYNDNENAEEVQAEVPQMDGSSASLGMDIQLKVENINALLEYTRMMMHEMKMVTANELSNLNSWKLNRYDKDVTEFNLDDYIFKKETTKDKIVDALKNVKEKGVKGAIEDAVNDATGNQTASSAPQTTDDPLESVRSELRQVRSKSGKYEGVDEAGKKKKKKKKVTEEQKNIRNKGENWKEGL